GDPADGYRMPQEVANSSGPVRVIASGTVNGYGFSFQSFVRAGSTDESGPCLGFAGPGLDHFASPGPQPPDAVGGISSGTCAGAQICKYSQVSGGCGGVVKQLAPISRT